MNLSVIDIIFLVLIAIFIIRCFLKGFIGELLSMAALVLGLLAALFFYKNGGEFLRVRFWPELNVIPEIAAFAAIFLIVFLVVKILEFLLKGIIEGLKLGNADRFLGIIFGLAESIAVISLILFLLRIQPLFDSSSILSGSIFARILLPLIMGSEKTIDV